MLSVLFEAVFGRLDYKRHTAKDKTDKAEACRKRKATRAWCTSRIRRKRKIC